MVNRKRTNLYFELTLLRYTIVVAFSQKDEYEDVIDYFRKSLSKVSLPQIRYKIGEKFSEMAESSYSYYA